MTSQTAQRGQQPEAAGQPAISIEALNERWSIAMNAPWRGGLNTKLWGRLDRVLTDIICRMAMVDDDDVTNLRAMGGIDMVGTLMENLRRDVIRIIWDHGLMRTGYEGITGEPPEMIR